MSSTFSLPPLYIIPATATAATLDLRTPGAPLLVQLAARPWAPALRLEGTGLSAPTLAVVRDAFHPACASSAPPRPLASLVASLGPGAAALAAHDAAGTPVWGLVADEYERRPDGGYSLRAASTPLAALLSKAGLRVCRAHDTASALASIKAASSTPSARQSTNEVLMVSPATFGFNAQAAADNFFMNQTAGTPPSSSAAGDARQEETVTQAALREHAGLVRALTEEAGVRVTLLEHAPAHDTPDAVFPNNWFSTHAAGEAGGGVAERTLVYYPLKCPNRAAERRGDARAVLEGRFGGRGRVLDLSPAEAGAAPAPFPPAPAFFEGTGVLVLDRVHGTAYVCLSERADAGLAAIWAEAVGYRDVVTFRAADARGAPIYHTNVMMAVGSGVAVVCLAAVRDDKERARLRDSLSRHHAVVDISLAQVDAMCGNVLEVEDGAGAPVLAMSTRAWTAFGAEGRADLLKGGVAALVHAPFDTIETVGGGGVRCALAELF